MGVGVGTAEVQAGVCDPTVGVGRSGHGRAVLTVNMKRMLLTLDVSQLNGWLNPCSSVT